MKIKRREVKCEMPLASIGDIVFNLLIFFVILAKAQDDSHLKWTPAKSPQIEEAGHVKTSVLLDDQGKLYLNGQEIGLDQLAAEVENSLANAGPAERKVLLKVHQDTPSQRFEPVIEAIAKAGGELWLVLEKGKP